MTSSVPGPIRTGAAGAAPAGQVAQELRAVVGHRDAGGQGVAGRLGRGDADHRAQPGLSPDPRGLGQHPGLPGPGWRVDHRNELAVGQCRPRGGGLVLTQPGLRARRVRVRVACASQRILQLRRICTERVRGLRAVHARRAARAGLCKHALFHRQLRAGGVPGAAMSLINAAPIGAQQAARHLHQLGRIQARHRLELRRQRPVGQVLQQGGGCGRVHAGPGQHTAQVLDHVRTGPRGLVLLRQRNRLLRRASHLDLGQGCAG